MCGWWTWWKFGNDDKDKKRGGQAQSCVFAPICPQSWYDGHTKVASSAISERRIVVFSAMWSWQWWVGHGCYRYGTSCGNTKYGVMIRHEMGGKDKTRGNGPVLSSFNVTLNTYSLYQHSWPRRGFLSIPCIHFDMFLNLVRWTILKWRPPQFRRDGELYFFECEVHGDGSDIAVTDMTR